MCRIKTFSFSQKTSDSAFCRGYPVGGDFLWKEDRKARLPASFGIKRLNIVIFGLKNATLVPYVLNIAKNATNQEELDEMYGMLESYMMRRITVHTSTKYYYNLFTSRLFNKVLTSDALREKLLSYKEINANVSNDYELEEGFKKSRLVNYQSKGILFLIDSKIRPTGASTPMLGFNSYSLEHLMPKKWRNRWPSCETEYLANKRDYTLLTLGNLAIITQS